MDRLTLKAYGKINLGLDVIRKREDGYHDVSMIMQSVGIFDTLEFAKTKEAGIFLTTNCEGLPTDQNNLIYKSIQMLFKAYPIKGGLRVHLTKRIPILAGMGGGSSDAAAALVGANQLFELGLSIEELREYGRTLGADIPFCLTGGTMYAAGIGEKLTTLPNCPTCALLIAKPPIDVSTKAVYGGLRIDEQTKHPLIDSIKKGLAEGDIVAISNHMGNLLEDVTIKKHAIIEQLKEAMIQSGAIGALMSGSGPTVFGIYEKKSDAERAKKKIESKWLGTTFFVTEPVKNGIKMEEHICQQ